MPYTKPKSIKKAEGHLPSPQERESKPYTHKQETPPAYSREHLSVSLCVWNNFDFSPAQKSAKHFFLQYVKTRSVSDRTNITICRVKGFMNLYFFPVVLKFSIYEIPSSFRTTSFADEKKPLQCLNSVFAFSKSSPCFLSVSKRA